MFTLDTPITSDWHLRHKRLVEEWFDRPFDTIQSHDDSTITQFNALVGPNDHAIVAGDLVLGIHPDNIRDVLSQLNGKLHLVVGNHDYNVVKRCSDRFESIQKSLTVTFDDVAFFITHKPQPRWNDVESKKTYHLHGHCHGKSTFMTNRLDIGVDGPITNRPEKDTTHYRGRPWTFREILEHFQTREIQP